MDQATRLPPVSLLHVAIWSLTASFSFLSRAIRTSSGQRWRASRSISGVEADMLAPEIVDMFAGHLLLHAKLRMLQACGPQRGYRKGTSSFQWVEGEFERPPPSACYIDRGWRTCAMSDPAPRPKAASIIPAASDDLLKRTPARSKSGGRKMKSRIS